MTNEEILAKILWERDGEKSVYYGSDWKVFTREFPLETKAWIGKARKIISDLDANDLYIVTSDEIDGG